MLDEGEREEGGTRRKEESGGRRYEKSEKMKNLLTKMKMKKSLKDASLASLGLAYTCKCITKALRSDGPTNRRSDTCSYRDAGTHLIKEV